MKIKLHHPLWVHIPVFGVFLYFIIRVVSAGPFPDSVPIHFDFSGIPNNYGSPWSVFGFTIGYSLLFIGISILLDEIWARHEKRKSFNWFTFLDEIIIGFLVAISLGQLDMINSGTNIFTFPTNTILIIILPSVAAVWILEILRQPHPQMPSSPAEDPLAVIQSAEKKVRESAVFLYWESQNPFWMTILNIVLPLLLVGLGIFIMTQTITGGLPLLIVGILMILLYGGLRTRINRENITVNFGLLPFKVLNLKVSSIDHVELFEFSPLKDFGGYGIRFNSKMTAYFLRGNRGVLFKTTSGKQYLIGSDHPEHLYAVAQAVIKYR